VDVHAAFGIPRERVIIVTVGRAHRYKGIEFALTVIRELTKGCTPSAVHYLFCGDGPDLHLFRDLAHRYELGDRVTFAGKRDDVRSLLKGCSIALHPSKGEVGYSLSILEYMEAALPVIVPDNPSVCEAAVDGETGFIYREGDIADAVRTVRRLLSDPDLRNYLGAAGVERQRQEYKLQASHKKLIAIMERVDQYCPRSDAFRDGM
jgi:glycosyltransferase involved in cell wall biosynthesis